MPPMVQLPFAALLLLGIAGALTVFIDLIFSFAPPIPQNILDRRAAIEHERKMAERDAQYAREHPDEIFF